MHPLVVPGPSIDNRKYPIHTEEAARRTFIQLKKDRDTGKLSNDKFFEGLSDIYRRWPSLQDSLLVSGGVYEGKKA